MNPIYRAYMGNYYYIASFEDLIITPTISKEEKKVSIDEIDSLLKELMLENMDDVPSNKPSELIPPTNLKKCFEPEDFDLSADKHPRFENEKNSNIDDEKDNNKMDIEENPSNEAPILTHPANSRKRLAPEDFDVSAAKRPRFEDEKNPNIDNEIDKDKMDIEENPSIEASILTQPANSRKRFAPKDFDVSAAKRPRFEDDAIKIDKAPSVPLNKGISNLSDVMLDTSNDNLSKKLTTLIIASVCERLLKNSSVLQ